MLTVPKWKGRFQNEENLPCAWFRMNDQNVNTNIVNARNSQVVCSTATQVFRILMISKLFRKPTFSSKENTYTTLKFAFIHSLLHRYINLFVFVCEMQVRKFIECVVSTFISSEYRIEIEEHSIYLHVHKKCLDYSFVVLHTVWNRLTKRTKTVH